MGYITCMAYSDILRKFEKRKAWMVKMRKQGVADAAIAKMLGISRARVGQILGAKNGR